MVSAELALAIPTVLAVLVLCLSAVQVGVDRVRCVQAAGVGVRDLVRGDPPDRVRSDAARVAPSGAVVSWSGGDVVTVRVTHRPGSSACSTCPSRSRQTPPDASNG